MPSQSKKSGFTLVELLVVIAIIGILMGMLLPAVQQVREAARRTDCLNRIRQLGLATHNFESSLGHFPTAGGASNQFWNEDGAAAYGFENASWMYQILPYIEQQNLFKNRATIGMFQGISEVPVQTFNCPSRSGRFCNFGGFATFQLNDYAGVVSSRYDSTNWREWQWRDWQDPYPEEMKTFTGMIIKGGQVNTSTGQVWKYPTIGFEACLDGTSNTILYAEKAVNAKHYTIATADGWDYWELMGYYTGADWPHMRMFGANIDASGSVDEIVVLGDTERRPDSWLESNGHTFEQGFGSAHPGVFTAVMTDGSTRAIARTADLVVLDAMGKRADGTVANLD